MAKKKKTRQQKIVAELRRQLLKKTLSSQKDQIVKVVNPQKTAPDKEVIIQTVNRKNTELNYSYLIGDLKKIAILTISIIAIQFILFFSLTNKILVLPGLSY